MPKSVLLSKEAACAKTVEQGGNTRKRVSGTTLFLPSRSRAIREKWIADHVLWLNKESGRVFVRARLNDSDMWMDAVTGSIYGQDGRCLTSKTLTVDVSLMYLDQERASEVLMNAKTLGHRMV